MSFFQSNERAAFCLLMDEVASYEVKNLCGLMDAIFSEAVSDEIAEISKKKCRDCKVDYPSQRRHECLMLTLEESWTMYGLDAIEQVIERGILWKLFNEAIRVQKLDYYEVVREHYENLTKNYERTLEFLKDLRYNSEFFDYQAILGYLYYWSENQCA